MRMYAEIMFDREIDVDKHYISPGGYEVELRNGKEIQFDFCYFEGNISKEDKRILQCEFRNLDTEAFPKSKNFNPKDISNISEFFVYTGGEEDDEEELHPVKLLSLGFSWEDKEYEVPEDIVNRAYVTDGYVNYSLFVLDFDQTYDNELIGAKNQSEVYGVCPSVYQIPTLRMEDVKKAAQYAHDMFHEEENETCIAEWFQDYLKDHGIAYHVVGELNIPFYERQQEYLSDKIGYECI